MATTVLGWNPDNYDEDYSGVVRGTRAGRVVKGRWSVARPTASMGVGNRAILLRQGGDESERGVVATGTLTSDAYPGPHYRDLNSTATYVDVAWDAWVDERDRLRLGDLERLVPGVGWRRSFRSSGNRLDPDHEAPFERVWAAHLKQLGLAPIASPAEATPLFAEGAMTTVKVNRYERDQVAREKCIGAHGTACAACGFDFEDVYGALGKGYIEVHHVEDISLGPRAVDPVGDLVPLCPNCHAMVHKASRPAMPVKQLTRLIARRRRARR